MGISVLLDRLFPKFGRKKLWPQTSPFFDILVSFETFLKNYPAKSEIEGLAESYKTIM